MLADRRGARCRFLNSQKGVLNPVTKEGVSRATSWLWCVLFGSGSCGLIAMRGNDGRKLDHGTLEVLRMRAVDQIAAGVPVATVAETLGLHRGSVYRWWWRFEREGREALKAKPVPGRPTAIRRSCPSTSGCGPAT